MKSFLLVAPLFLMFVFFAGWRLATVAVPEKPGGPHFVQRMAPGPNYIWRNGEWIKHGNTYTYHKGFWMKPPSYNRYYVEGDWQRRRACCLRFPVVGTRANHN